MVNGIMPGYEYNPEHCFLLGVDRASEGMVPLDIRMFNRHGFIGGATGTGKTVTIRQFVENLSQAGVPTLSVDAKGDLSGMIREGVLTEKLQKRVDVLDQYFWEPTSIPVQYIAPGGNGFGIPAKINVHTFPVKSMARILELSPAQTRNLMTAYREGRNDSMRPTETLEDLTALLEGMREDTDKSLTDSMAARIIEAVLNLADGATGLFGGGPEFDVIDLIQRDEYGWGQASIIDSSQLRDHPRIVTTFLLWVLDQLAKHLPEVGDREIKLVVFFDEAHLLFKGAPKEFTDEMVAKIKTLRSKGVGVFFCSQSDRDVPEDVLEQCAARVQHALRVNTHRQELNLKYTAANFPKSDVYDLAEEIRNMGVGQALVSVLDDDGFASKPALTVVFVPRSQMDPCTDEEIRDYVARHPLTAKYKRMYAEWAEHKRTGRYVPVDARVRPVEPVSRPADHTPYPDAPPTLTQRLRASLSRGENSDGTLSAQDVWQTSTTSE